MRAPAGAWIGRRHERSAAPSVPSGGRVQSALHGGDLPSAAGGRVVLRSCICSRPRLSHTQPSPPPAPAGTGWPAAARAPSRERARAGMLLAGPTHSGDLRSVAPTPRAAGRGVCLAYFDVEVRMFKEHAR